MTLSSVPFAGFTEMDFESPHRVRAAPFATSRISQLGTLRCKNQLCNRSSAARLDLLELRRERL